MDYEVLLRRLSEINAGYRGLPGPRQSPVGAYEDIRLKGFSPRQLDASRDFDQLMQPGPPPERLPSPDEPGPPPDSPLGDDPWLHAEMLRRMNEDEGPFGVDPWLFFEEEGRRRRADHARYRPFGVNPH